MEVHRADRYQAVGPVSLCRDTSGNVARYDSRGSGLQSGVNDVLDAS